MKCVKCNSDIPENVKFCPKCGAKVEVAKAQDVQTKKCPSCGTENPISAKFCKVDGYNLQRVEEKPIEKPVEPKVERAASEAKAEERKAEAEKPKDMVICPKCGTLNPLTAKFCKKDGTPLKEEIKVPEPKVKPDVSIQPKVSEVTPKVEIKKEAVGKPSKKPIWIPITILLLVIIAGAGSYLYFSNWEKCLRDYYGKEAMPAQIRKEETFYPDRDYTGPMWIGINHSMLLVYTSPEIQCGPDSSAEIVWGPLETEPVKIGGDGAVIVFEKKKKDSVPITVIVNGCRPISELGYGKSYLNPRVAFTRGMIKEPKWRKR